jgi:hypothetical protein
MSNSPPEIEALIVKEREAEFRRTGAEWLIAQRNADIQRFSTETPLLTTPEDIRERLRSLLLLSIEVKAEHCTEEQWRSGTPGAILEGRMSMLRELLDWLENEA